MALLSRINAVCNLCRANRAFSTFRANSRYSVKFGGPQNPSEIAQDPVRGRPMSIFAIFRRPSVQKLKEQDNIPDEYLLIYRNTMSKYLLAGQIFSTVCAGIVCLSITATNWFSTVETWQSMSSGLNNEAIVFLTAFIGVCTMLQVYVSRMPIRIYYLRQQKTYIMILYRSIPFTTKRVTYSANQVTKLPPAGILPWNDSKYRITDMQNVIIIDNYFRKPADYNIMLGYQKDNEDDDEH